MIAHWRKFQFFHVKSCFRNWMRNADIEERREILKKEEVRLADCQFQHEQQTKAFVNAHGKLNEELAEVKVM